MELTVKTPLLAVLFSVAILGLIVAVGRRFWDSPAAAMPQANAALSRIDERLERLERSLDRLADLERQVARLSAGQDAPPPATAPGAEPAEAAVAEALPAGADQGKGPSK